ncbi:MAG: chorismate mutase [Treponema sp.]|nr:chorismate mutase [Treponema sp.]
MKGKRLYALRAAVQCENTKEDIQEKTVEVFDKIIEKNRLPLEDIVSIIFSQTNDLNAVNPATALRQTGRAADIALFAVKEIETANAYPRIIRLLIHCYLPEGSKPKHLYCNGAEALRPDWSEEV